MEYSTLLTHFSNITHVFTTRHGGCSTAPYSSNNLAFHVGDNKEDVSANHKALAKQLGYDYKRLVHMQQIHSNKVVVVTNEDFNTPPQCDALITNKMDVPLMIMSADCTPILLYDDVRKVIGVIHAGRAGAFSNIIQETLQSMQKHFNVEAHNVYAVLGASIQLCCYEVGEAIYNEAQEKGFTYATHIREEKHYLDVNAIVHQQLKDAKVLASHIEDLRICTACKHDSYFSYRADEQVTGRMASLIMLREI